MEESYLDRRERFRQQGKIELPQNIDNKKYLLANIAFADLLIMAPAFILTILIVVIYYFMTGSINQIIIIISLTPSIVMFLLQTIKHPERKNLPIWQYKILWKINFNNRKKEFYYSKGNPEMSDKKIEEDTRSRLPISNIANGSIETKDKRLVKIIEVSSINLSLMSNTDQNNVFETFKDFLNELDDKEIQISQIAQPINLDSYSAWVADTAREDKSSLRKLKQAYLGQIDDIQKNKSMVTRKRYISVSVPNKRGAEDSIDRKANHIKFKLESMRFGVNGTSGLNAKVLKNDELIELMYATIDFENAQSQGSSIVQKAETQTPIVLGENTRKQVEEALKEQAATSFN